MSSNTVYLGVKAHVAAIAKNDGRTLWKTKLRAGQLSGDSFVTLLVQGRRVFAHTYGELFCLDAETGQILWQNTLDGLGYGIASLAADGIASGPPTSLLKEKQQNDAAAAGTTVAATG